MKPTKEQIIEQINLATETDGACFGMTYEEGVKEALLWAIGDSSDPPIDSEKDL